MISLQLSLFLVLVNLWKRRLLSNTCTYALFQFTMFSICKYSFPGLIMQIFLVFLNSPGLRDQLVSPLFLTVGLWFVALSCAVLDTRTDLCSLQNLVYMYICTIVY